MSPWIDICAKLASALSSPVRVQMMLIAERETMCLADLAERIDVSPSASAISRHAHVLTQCGMATLERHGRHRVLRPLDGPWWPLLRAPGEPLRR